MIKKDAFADLGCRMDIGLKDFGRPALQIKREIVAAFRPEPMRKPMRCQRVKSFEIKQRFDQPLAARIAVEKRQEVSTESDADRRITGGDV